MKTVIKRYQNRKLYDTNESCYITLEEVGTLVKIGHEVQVIDNKTKSDITALTLLQVMFDKERKKIIDNHVDATSVDTLHQALRLGW